MLQRRPPSGYHWCRKGYRERNPDELQLDDDDIYNVYNVASTVEDTKTNTQAEVVKRHDFDGANACTQQEALDELVFALPKSLPFETVEDVLKYDPEYFNELEGDDLEEFSYDYEESYEEDDDLGYYPDGVKRTLTDEQIAIFRHTEEQQIETARRRALERLSDIGEEAHAAVSDKDDISSAATNGKTTRPEVPYKQRHKRKWENYVERQDPKHGSITHRRAARELDEVKSTNVSIDYGEEESTATSERSQQAAFTSRRLVSYADD